MAERRLYALFDKAISRYLNPLVFTTDQEALRWFSNVVNQVDPQNSVYVNHEDYALFYLGTLDDASGIFTNAAKRLADGPSVKAFDHLPVNQTEFFKQLEELLTHYQEK